MTNDTIIKLMLLAALGSSAGTVFAGAAAGDAGRLLEQVQDPDAAPGFLAPQESDAPDITDEEKEAAKDTEAAESDDKILAKEFRFDRTTVFPHSVLLKLVEDAIGKELSLQDLEALALRVTEYHRRHGVALTRAYIPPQEISDGIVTIGIEEGRFGEARIISEGARISNEKAEQVITGAKNYQNHVLRDKAIQRGLLLLNDWPGVNAHGVLAPGTEPGQVEMRILLEPDPIGKGRAYIDNQGYRFTGTLRGGLRGQLNAPFGFGEILEGHWLQSSGSTLLQGGASVPFLGKLGARGARIGATYTHLQYKLCCQFSSLDVRGRASELSFNFRYPLMRTLARTIRLELSASGRDLFTKTTTGTTNDRKLFLGSVNLRMEMRDTLLSGGSTQASITATQGYTQIDNTSLRTTDADTVRTHGNYTLLRAGLAKIQFLDANRRWLVRLGLNGQVAFDNLDPSEKQSLGGASRVRGYPEGEASGNNMWRASIDLRWQPISSLQLGPFYDYGCIRQYHTLWNTWNTSGRARNAYCLQSAGATATLRLPYDIWLQGSYARALGTNYGRDANGNNSDSRRLKDRFWFQVRKDF